VKRFGRKGSTFSDATRIFFLAFVTGSREPPLAAG
jgi:hypothetical protein